MTEELALDGVGADVPASHLAAVAAAHVVLSGRRQATRLDLLLSTISEVLTAGAQHEEEIITSVRGAWPAAEIADHDIVEALQLGSQPKAGLFLRSDGLDGVLWRLDDAGRAEADAAQHWVADVRRRAVADVRVRAAVDFRECTEREADLWVQRLTSSLSEAIAAVELTYLGSVEATTEHLHPRSVDRARLMARLSDGVDEAVAEFLRAAALAALDASDAFGNELVSTLVTTCVLHGHLARLDLAEQQKRLGPLEGQEVVLDTPILLSLVSGADSREPIEQMISAARAAGVQVIALKHYLEELTGLLKARRPIAMLEESLLSDPDKRAAYIALTEGDEVVVAYARARSERLVDNWEGFEAYVWGLERRLVALGVDVRPAGNHDADQVRQCRQALEDILFEEARGRATAAIERDAEALSLALRHRRDFRRANPSVAWPGLFIITYDRRLTPAYASLPNGDDGFQVALTPSMFMLLLARVRPVPEVAALTEAASRLLTREIAERVAVRYPPAVAAELAQQLGGVGGGTDVRVAQMENVSQVIEAADASDVAAEVFRRRLLRTRAASMHVSSLSTAERAASDERLRFEKLATATSEGRRLATADRLVEEQEATQRLQGELETRLTRQEAATLARRSSIRVLSAVLNLGAVAWFGVQGKLVLAIVVAVAGMLLWFQTADWVVTPSARLRSAVVGIAADTLSLCVALADTLNDHLK